MEKSGTHNVLPIVVKMCERINRIFVRYVGPIAPEIAEDIYKQWVRRGNTGPSGVIRYIHLLSQNIFDESQRVTFFDEATQAMRASVGVTPTNR